MSIENQSRWTEGELAGHLAGEADHAKNERTGDTLGDIFDEIEGLLDLSVEEKSPVD